MSILPTRSLDGLINAARRQLLAAMPAPRGRDNRHNDGGIGGALGEGDINE